MGWGTVQHAAQRVALRPAAADMWLLGECDDVVTTSGSTFGYVRCARILGKALFAVPSSAAQYIPARHSSGRDNAYAGARRAAAAHVPRKTADFGNKESETCRRLQLGSVVSTVPH